MKAAIIGALAFIALAGTAQAQTTVIRGEDTVVVKKKTTLDFTDVRLDGVLTRPEISYFQAPPKAKFTSMIKLRANFQPELADSVNHL